MAGGRRVLITGVASPAGSALARRLARDAEFDHVAGLDTRSPGRIDGLEFIDLDIRDPALTDVLARAEVDTLIHNQIVRQPHGQMSARAMHDVNVIGSLQLVTACERAPSLRSIVIRGSAGIYGAEPGAPQFFTEDMTRLFPLRSRFQRDVAEIETYFETFARRHPEVTVTMLRYQPAIGPHLDTQVTRYLSSRVVPTYLGYDPRMQFLHRDDGLDALVAAVRSPVHGAVNVAAPQTIGLMRLIRTAGRVPLPLASPAFASATRTLRRVGLPRLSEDFQRLLRHGRAVDTTRLTQEVGFTPRRSTPAAVADYVAGRDT